MPSFWVTGGGIALSFIGNTINALGMVYQKLGHMRVRRARATAHHALTTWRLEKAGCSVGPVKYFDAEKPGQEQCLLSVCVKADEHTFLMEPLWIFGFAIYILGSLMHVAALGFGPQALLMPMEAATLAANAVLAPLLLGEELTRNGIIGTSIVIFGIVITVIFGPHSSITYTAEEMLAMLAQGPFLAWSIAIVVFTSMVFAAMHVQKARNQAAGIVMDGGMEKPGSRVICFAYVWIAGVFSSATMLTAKQTMELLETTLSGNNQFTQALPFVIILNFIVMNFIMEYWKQKALATFSALVVVPLFQVCLVVLSVIGGAIYFNEFEGMELYRILLFMLGLIIVCGGIVLLSAPAKNPGKIPGRTVFTLAYVVLVAQKLLRRVRDKEAYRAHPKVGAVSPDEDDTSLGAGVHPVAANASAVVPAPPWQRPVVDTWHRPDLAEEQRRLDESVSPNRSPLSQSEVSVPMADLQQQLEHRPQRLSQISMREEDSLPNVPIHEEKPADATTLSSPVQRRHSRNGDFVGTS